MPSDKRQRQRANAQVGRQAAAQARRRKDTRRRIFVTIIIIAVIVGVAGLVSIQDNDPDTVATATTVADTRIPEVTSTTTAGPAAEPVCPAPDGSSPQIRQFSGPFDGCIDNNKNYIATVETDVGTYKVRLDPKKAPKAVNNFVSLARYHYFDGITFHRVIPDFVIQGGDPTGSGSGGPGYSFEDELPAPGDYKGGSLAMANSGPNTNGSQFFVITSDTGAQKLVAAVGGEAKYSLFGQVEEGMEVVKQIEADGSTDGKPKVVHRMVKVTIEEVEAKS